MKAIENSLSTDELKKRVSDFPDHSGVYLMKNSTEKVIYVGKAKNLKQRVRSYFTDSKDHTPKTRLLVSHIVLIEYILTKTEVEAFLLEASLIKKYRPKYNIRLKDDKSYPYIRVSMKDHYPRLYLSRTVKPDGSLYFGPYTKGGSVFETMRFLNQTFQLRDCTDHILKSRERPCINFQLNRCSAPCIQNISIEKYRLEIDKVLKFLKGQSQELIQDLRIKMLKLSEEEKYEQAARWRDTLNSLNSILEKQSVVDPSSQKDLDIFTFCGDGRGTIIQMMHVRQGRVLGMRNQFLSGFNSQDSVEDPREWFVSLINQYYWENMIPDEILVSFDIGIEMMRLLEKVLMERKGYEVHIKLGTSEEKERELLELTLKNAKHALEKQSEKAETKRQGLEEIKLKLDLPKWPHRIECYDISNFQGQQIVASQVVFEDGQPASDQYRLYKIKSLNQANDFASMNEVLTRRFQHEEWDEPQLIIVDGGKGQLSAGLQALIEVGRSHIPIVALAKAKTISDFENINVKSTEERIFIPGRMNPLLFSKNSEAYRIFTQIRDEAHRFAITYHRKKRSDESLSSILDQVKGLGVKRKLTLLKKYENLEIIQSTSVEELAQLPGFSLGLAKRIKQELLSLSHKNIHDI